MAALIGTSLLLVGSLALAQDTSQERSAEGRLRIYTDNDHVTVVSPSTAASFPLSKALGVEVGSTIDVVSAASVDVITQASPTAVHEVRVEGNAALTWAVSRLQRWRAGAVLSHENDYDSARPTIGAQLEVAERNATIDLSYTASIDRVTSTIDPNFKRARRGHIVAASFTQILDRKTYADVLLDLRRFRGYHASPYRRVPLVDPFSSELVRVEERTPSVRQSAAMLLRLRRALGQEEHWFVQAGYRYYRDDWQVASHTLRGQLLRALASDRLLLSLGVRGYFQGPAEFYQARYEASASEEAPEYRTRDRILGGMRTLSASLTVDASLSGNTQEEGWRVRTDLSTAAFSYQNFPAQKERLAMTLGLSIVAPL